jgi:hypothetical protein
MIELLIGAGAKFNTTEKTDERSIIPLNFIDPFISSYVFINSLILTKNEGISLIELLNDLTEVKLIYRASRDGFAASSFHSKCDDTSNTVTIIKTTSNSVFGGFTSATWTSNDEWLYDANAFIFSLRRSGNPNKERFNVTQPENAIYGSYKNGPAFGGGYDIYVSGHSNLNETSFSYPGRSYQSPQDFSFENPEARIYLAGTPRWQTVEIEVYQLTPFILYAVTFLHNGCLF